MEFHKQQENGIAEYYNKNTARFLRFGRAGRTGTIHRRLYSRQKPDSEPSLFSDSIILNEIKKIRTTRVLDLGCGIGATIRYLKTRYKADYTGITLSPVQYKIAAELNTEVELGSYLDPKWYSERPAFDIVYAIESLQHNPNHNLLLDNLKGIMTEGSRLIIIDDYINDAENIGLKDQKLIDRFKKYWHAHGFTSVQEFIELAETKGFKLTENVNLTDLMKKPAINHKMRAVYLSILSIIPGKNAAMYNLIGGGTLTLLQQKKLSGYYKLVFRSN